MILNYSDIYYFFIIIFILSFLTIFNKSYINYKIEDGFFSKQNHSKTIIYCFLLMFFIIILNSIDLSIDINKIDLNLQVVYKLILYLFSFYYFIIFKQYTNLFKFFTFESIWILSFSLFCLNLLIECNNLLYFYVILESYSLSILSFLVLKKLNRKFLNSAFNYLILNVIVSCLILYSISLIYYLSGFTNFCDINDLINSGSLSVAKLYFLLFTIFSIIICFFIKLSIFPFSIYLLDIYSKFSSFHVFFFLIIPKFCFSVILFYNFLFVLNILSYTLYQSLIYLILVTSIIHTLFSSKDLSIKNLIINTSFSNAPFLLSPIFCKNIFLITGFFNFYIIYFFNVFFFFVLMFLVCINVKNIFKKFVNIFGLIYVNLTLSIVVISFFISLSSLPPFSGFFAKFFIFYFFIEYKMYYLYFILSLLNLVIVYSYLKSFKNVFNKKRNFYIKNFYKNNKFIIFLLSLFFLLNLFFLIFFDIIYKIIFILLNQTAIL